MKAFLAKHIKVIGITVLAMLLLFLFGQMCPVEAQDTTMTRLSSDTVVTPPDSTLVDSTPRTTSRTVVDTVGWDYRYRVTPGRRVVTDIWEWIETLILGEPDSTPADTSSADLSFNDVTDLGLTCAYSRLGGAECPNFPAQPWRKHEYLPTGGRTGGAINMHWFTGMQVGFSPIWIEPVPFSRHFKASYWVRQTAPMVHAGSAVKLHRIRAGSGTTHRNIGTLESINGRMKWYWETWTSNDPVSAFDLGIDVPADSRWHLYELELDIRDTANLTFRFWLDGVLTKTLTIASRVGDLAAGSTELIFSPFAEMYSGCCSQINTGDYTVDDFTFTALP